MKSLKLAFLSAGSTALSAIIAERMAGERAAVEVVHVKPVEGSETTCEVVQTEPAAEEAKPENALDGLPDSHPDWRVNNAALAPITAQSPLETRQQRRSAAKALARGLATAGKLKEREARLMEKKRQRADEAAARWNRIKAHVPAKSGE